MRYADNDKALLFEQIEENIPGIMYRFIIDEQNMFRFTYVSKSVHNILGVSSEDVINNTHDFVDYIDQDDLIIFNESLEKAFLSNSLWEWQGQITVGKITRYLSTKASPDTSKKNIRLWTGFAFDITEKHQLEQELNKKENKLNALTHNFPGIVYEWFYNNDGSVGFNYASNKVKEILDLEPEEINNLTSLFKEDDYKKYIELSKKNIEELSDFDFETEIDLKNGQKKWLKFISCPSKYNDEQVIYNGIILDITKLKNYEEKIKEREQIIIETQKMAKSGSWEFYPKLKKLVWTEGMYNIFEIPQNIPNLLKNYFARIHPEDLKKVSDIIQSVPSDDKVNPLEYRVKTDDGRIKYLYATIKPIRNSDGTIEKYWGTTQDITENKEKEHEIIIAKNLAEQANIAKSQFLSTMSHELRTPINAIIGITNLLFQNSPKLDQMENLRILRFSSENLLVLVNDILDFNKIEAGKIEFEEVRFSLKNLINNIRSALLHLSDEKNILLELFIDSSVPEFIIGDPTRLGQVITNLVSNAIKFTNQGLVKICLELIKTEKLCTTIKFSVKDTGIGISEDKINYIFESFTQASSETNRLFGGTGLGLAITKRLIELMNGEIKVESTPDQGSNFYFNLEFKNADSQDIFNNKQEDYNNSSLEGLRVLLVEDNKINNMIATQFLKKWDVNVDSAENGQEAIEKIKANKYDLILMDLQMPVMDGYQASATIREIHYDIPIIALTASATIEIKEKIAEVGITDVVTKPFNPNELHRKLKIHKK